MKTVEKEKQGKVEAKLAKQAEVQRRKQAKQEEQQRKKEALQQAKMEKEQRKGKVKQSLQSNQTKLPWKRNDPQSAMPNYPTSVSEEVEEDVLVVSEELEILSRTEEEVELSEEAGSEEESAEESEEEFEEESKDSNVEGVAPKQPHPSQQPPKISHCGQPVAGNISRYSKSGELQSDSSVQAEEIAQKLMKDEVGQIIEETRCWLNKAKQVLKDLENSSKRTSKTEDRSGRGSERSGGEVAGNAYHGSRDYE